MRPLETASVFALATAAARRVCSALSEHALSAVKTANDKTSFRTMHLRCD